MKKDAGARSERWPLVGLAVGVVGATLVLFHRALSEDVFIAKDIQFVYYPLRKYWAERVLAGGFPDWYPYDSLGQPFVGMVISGAFHPANLLYLVLPLATALKVNVLLCFPFAFGGAYLFARGWGAERTAAAFAGTVFAFSGYMVGITNNLLYLMAAATFPWALWAADRFFRAPSVLRAATAAGLLVLVLFAGDSQSFAVSCGLVLLVAASRWERGRGARITLGAAGLLGLAASFAAVQILPAMVALPIISAGRQPISEALLWSTHPLRLLELFFGNLFSGDPGTMLSAAINQRLLGTGYDRLWVESLHVGAPALVLAAAGLWAGRRSVRTWLVVGTAVVMGTLMLGKFAGLYEVLFRLLPPWRPFRYPEKLFPYVGLCIALGAAAGLQAALRDARFRRRVSVALAAAGLASLALLGVGLWLGVVDRVVRATWDGSVPEGALARIEAGLTRGSVTAAVAALAAALALGAVRRTELAGALVGGVACLLLLVTNEPVYELTSPDVLEMRTGFTEEILSREGALTPGGYRVFAKVDMYTKPRLAGLTSTDSFAVAVATALEPVTPAMWGLAGANRYLPAGLRRLGELLGEERTWFGRYAGLFSARYLTVSSEFYGKIHGNADAIVAEHRGLELLLLKNPTALPRAYLARPRCVGSGEEARQLLRSRDFRPDREAVVECVEPLPVAPVEVGRLGEAAIVSYAPERVELRVDAAADALLVLTDAFYPGWRVTVDGVPADILQTNYLVRGVPLGPGTHSVVFTYRTPGLVAGAAVSGGSLLLAFALGLLRGRGRLRLGSRC